jgi:deoxyribodipyrimidine photo-lyase
MVEQQRIQALNSKPVLRELPFVVYWMQASQRIADNPAFTYAVLHANALGKPLVVYFCLLPDFPEGTRRSYRFMLEGLREVGEELRRRNIRFALDTRGPLVGLRELAERSALVVVDRAYGRFERTWRKQVAEAAMCSVVQVEGNVVVPVEAVSNKEEYSAATLRRKIEPMTVHFAQPSHPVEATIDSKDVEIPGTEASLDNIGAMLSSLGISDTAHEVSWLQGGESRANRQLEHFLDRYLDGYASRHNDPGDPYVSFLSPYLHFGQISPVTIYTKVASMPLPDVPVFLEELVVRRELAMNFVHFNPLYDQYEGLPAWAVKTLEHHVADPRPYRYSLVELETAATHDPYWNAAQRELVGLGTIHGYMRMYWGKKILEWSPTPRKAFDIALYLNNTYQLDGRDPNGFAGVAWCFGKHDRPWVERPIFGNVRYMNDKGLERKFDMKRYIERVDSAVEKERIGD